MSVGVDNLTISATAAGPLVRGVSFTVEAGGGLTILGETGSGKSLLSQAIMGTLPTDLQATGGVTIAGVTTPAQSSARRRLWGHTLALLPQEPWSSLDPTMRALAQVAEGFDERDPRIARARALTAIDALGLRGADRKFPIMLSGGMAQRVALAATTAGGASVLLVDEPTKGLDAALRDDVVAVLKAVRANGRTLVTITHDVGVARALGGQIGVMLEGRLIEVGPAEMILAAPAHPYTRRLLAAEPSAWPARAAPMLGRLLLRGRGLTKRYGPNTLFQNFDIDIQAGQRLAVTGPSGSGKTTLGDALLGLVRLDAGQITRAPDMPAIKLQKLFQDPVAAFAPHATLRRLLNDLAQRHQIAFSEMERLMARLRLDPGLLDRRPHQVSGGELQRFAIVRLLALSPAVIFADEPTSRLDPITQQETLDLLVEHTTERSCALLLVTHDPRIAANIASAAPIDIAPREAANAHRQDG
jgi:peptide/nickel transport system ATP-binding protein